MNSPTLTILAAAGLSLVLTSCGALIPKKDPTRFFFLQASSQGRLTTGSGLAVGIGPVTIPGYLDRKEIVTAGPANDLNLADFHVWAEPFEKAVTRVVAKNVSRLLDSPSVVPFPEADVKRDYTTTIIIRRFEMGADGVVRLDASYSIEGMTGSGRSGSSRSRTINATVAQPENYEAVSEAMSKALAELSSSIARDLLTLHRKDR